MSDQAVNLNDMEASLRDLGQKVDEGAILADDAVLPVKDPVDGQQDGKTDEGKEKGKLQPPADPADSSGTSPEKKPETEEKKPEEKKSRYQERITELVAAKKDAEAKADQRIKELESKLAEAEKGKQQAAGTGQPGSGKPDAKPSGKRDEHGYTADDYDAAAKQFDADGEPDLAQRAKARAQQMRQTEQANQQEAATQEFVESYNKDIEQNLADVPELKDGNTDLSKTVQALLASEPVFGSIPKGFSKAVQIAKLQLDAGLVPGLRQENEALKKENQRLNEALSLQSANPQKPPVEKRFEELSDVEQIEHLRHVAAQADAAA
jgi:hypothetical protein